MFVVLVACIEFSDADVLSQLGNAVCQWHPSDDCIADSCRNLNPGCLMFCSCNFSGASSIFGFTTEMVLEGFYMGKAGSKCAEWIFMYVMLHTNEDTFLMIILIWFHPLESFRFFFSAMLGVDSKTQNWQMWNRISSVLMMVLRIATL